MTTRQGSGSLVEVTLSVSHGKLGLFNTTGVAFIAGANDSASMSIFGTIGNINTDLRSLAYNPTNGYTGDDSLVISAGEGHGSATVPIYVNDWTNSTFASLVSEQQATGGGGLDLGSEFTLLLPNGDLMVHGSGQLVNNAFVASANWYEVTPDSTGSYADGTWKQLTSMSVGRQDFASDVLPNGDVLVLGGEYATDGKAINQLNNGTIEYSDSGEIYDPATNVWTTISSDPHISKNVFLTNLGYSTPVNINAIGDAPSEVLPDGRVLVGNIFDTGTEIYNPVKNTWTTGPNKSLGDGSGEESWVKLPNGDILTYDIYASLAARKGEGELYVPSTSGGIGNWTPATNGSFTVLTGAAFGYELGGAVLDPEGNVLFTGANGTTALYNTTTNTWSQGPLLPKAVIVPGSTPVQLGMGDAPAAMLPNGDALLTMSPLGFNATFPVPTLLYEYSPTLNLFTNVTPPTNVQNQNLNSFNDSMLVLPSGQVLMTNASPQLAFYNLAPGDGPAPDWAPTITSFTINSDGSYTLTGTQLNGLDEGAAYGDDKQMAENFPLVQLVNLSTGVVSYATTSNWSSTGVATGSTPETVNVALPPGIGGSNGTEVPFLVFAIVDGISSVPILRFLVGPGFPAQSVANGALGHLTDAGGLSIGAPSALDANNGSFQAPVPLTLSVANMTLPPASISRPSQDPAPDYLMSAAVSSLPARFNAALDTAESVQWAGLSVALDILSA